MTLATPTGDPRWARIAPENLTIINPLFLEVFPSLDMALSHRHDYISGEAAGLESHLVSVFTILKQWGAPDATCNAGLFHSIYEVGEHHAANVFTDRPRLQKLLGEEAERMVRETLLNFNPCAFLSMSGPSLQVYLFPPFNRLCNIDEQGPWGSPINAPSFVIKGRESMG